MTLEFILRVVGTNPVSITNCAVGLTLTPSASLVAITQFGSRGSGPKKTANLAPTLDHLTDKNHQLQKKNQELVDEVAAVRNKLVGPSEARSEVKAEKPPRKLRSGIVSRVRKVLI